jgi:hypothetical protein
MCVIHTIMWLIYDILVCVTLILLYVASIEYEFDS